MGRLRLCTCCSAHALPAACPGRRGIGSPLNLMLICLQAALMQRHHSASVVLAWGVHGVHCTAPWTAPDPDPRSAAMPCRKQTPTWLAGQAPAGRTHGRVVSVVHAVIPGDMQEPFTLPCHAWHARGIAGHFQRGVCRSWGPMQVGIGPRRTCVPDVSKDPHHKKNNPLSPNRTGGALTWHFDALANEPAEPCRSRLRGVAAFLCNANAPDTWTPTPNRTIGTD